MALELYKPTPINMVLGKILLRMQLLKISSISSFFSRKMIVSKESQFKLGLGIRKQLKILIKHCFHLCILPEIESGPYKKFPLPA